MVCNKQTRAARITEKTFGGIYFYCKYISEIFKKYKLKKMELCSDKKGVVRFFSIKYPCQWNNILWLFYLVDSSLAPLRKLGFNLRYCLWIRTHRTRCLRTPKYKFSACPRHSVEKQTQLMFFEILDKTLMSIAR